MHCEQPLVPGNRFASILPASYSPPEHKEPKQAFVMAKAEEQTVHAAGLGIAAPQTSSIPADQRITAILDSMTEAFCALDRDWRFVYINRRAEEIFRRLNHSRETVLGRSHWEVFPEALGTPLEESYRRAMREQVTVDLENYYPPMDAWFRVRGCPSPEGLSIYFQDITREKRNEDAIRQSEERFRAIVEATPECVKIVGPDGTLLAMNAAGCSMVDAANDHDVVGRNVYDIIAPEFREQFKALNENVCRGQTGQLQFQIIGLHGTRRWMETRAVPMRDPASGQIVQLAVTRDITARKQAEQALQETAERLQLAVAAGRLGDWRWDASNDLVTFGAKGYEIFGVNPDTPITWTALRELLHPDDQEQARLAVEKALAERSDYDIEYRVRQSSGEYRWVSALGRGVYAPDGRVTGMTGVVQDITVRKQAEQLLRRSEDQLRALANSIPQLAWMAEADGHIFWYNQRWYDYTGTTLEQMQGWGWQSVHDPEWLPKVVARWKSSLATGELFEMEFPLRGADGKFRWFLTRVAPVRDAEGRIIRWFGTNTDVETVRQAQEALREETRILELLNNTGTAIAAKLDLQSVVQIVTDAATELCGAKFGAFFYNVINEQGESFYLYSLSGAPREAFDRFGMPRNTPVFHHTFTGQGVVRSPDITQDPRYGKMGPHFGMPKGHLPVRSYLAVPVISRRKEVIGGLFFGHPEPDVFTERSERLVVGIAAQAAIAIDNARLYEAAQRELAERNRVAEELKKAQEELSRHAEQLEKEVTLRTASLREAVAQLEEFSYSVSHDLRAPIRAIAGYTRVLSLDYGDKLPAEAHVFLEKVTRSAQRMERLVNDVLIMSRVARAELKLCPVALQPLVEEIVEQHPSMQPTAALIRINTPHQVLADDASLTQALSNLLANAVKFVPAGRMPEVLIRSENVNGRIRIWVEDNGIGIRPDHQDKLFGMFQRLPTMENYEGTGIGLAIVRKAVERMGGTVGVVSNGTNGSRFWLELKEAL
jgi:PAS domain S-box-containing protein